MARRLLAFVVVGCLASVPLGALACALSCASHDAPAAVHHACQSDRTGSPRLGAVDACGDHDDTSAPSIAGTPSDGGVIADQSLATGPATLDTDTSVAVAPAARGADPPGARRSPLLRL